MSTDKITKIYQALRSEDRVLRKVDLELIEEEPLLIRINEKPYSVVMRTPGEEAPHAAGFCLGEGIADDPDDLALVSHCKDLDPNVIDVRLTPERAQAVQHVLDRRGFVSQTSCGICGKEMVEDIYQSVKPVDRELKLSIANIVDCTRILTTRQKHYKTTRGSHAALLVNEEREALSFAEDVGRHNALDKTIGKAFLSRDLSQAAIAVLSSRVSYELVQKAARARLPVMISASRPTALAVDMGKTLNITIAVCAGGSEVTVFSGENRIQAG